jgi:hypothetical protein
MPEEEFCKSAGGCSGLFFSPVCVVGAKSVAAREGSVNEPSTVQ